MKLDLSLNEINVIMQALGNAPYAQVFELVEKIRTQAQAQVQTTEQENG
jgi:hypothetical protein